MIVLETLGVRWYAFGFIVLFFWSAIAERPLTKALRFLGIATVVSLLAELSSTRNGIPYGSYSYTAPTRGEELYIANIPLFVPVSFGVVVWAGRALAIAGLKARTRGLQMLLGALCATTIDLVIDPMTLRGPTWFLGDLYAYASDGPWFGVPLSNFAGWFVVSAVIIGLDNIFDRDVEQVVHPLRGPTVAAFICLFFVVIALLTAHFAIAAAGALVTAVLLGACWPAIKRAVAQTAG